VAWVNERYAQQEVTMMQLQAEQKRYPAQPDSRDHSAALAYLATRPGFERAG
jgi:hypothetical protein